MIKYAIISTCTILFAGMVALVDRRSIDFAAHPKAEGRSQTPPTHPSQIYASGVVEGATRDVDLRPEEAGRVVEVLVKPGDWVDAGQVLVRLDDRRQQQQLAASVAKQRLAEAALDRLRNGARNSERREARALLAARQAQLEQAKLTWGRIHSLRAHDAISQQEADERQSQVHVLAAEVDAAQARIVQLEAPARQDEVRAAEARVDAARAEQELAALAVDKTLLRATSRGQVLEVKSEPGELVSPEDVDPVVILADTSQLRVRAFVEEADALRVSPGDVAAVSADGLGSQTLRGVVATLSPRMRIKTIDAGRAAELYDVRMREVLLDVAPASEAASKTASLIVGLRVDVMFQPDDAQE